MKAITPGHRYELQGNKETAPTVLQFYQDPRLHGVEVAGTTNQEVARALIDRLRYLEAEAPWGGDFHMIDNLRDLILVHEVRAAMRHGRCGLEAWRVLTAEAEAIGGIEHLVPRPGDGHVYPLGIHVAAACSGHCEDVPGSRVYRGAR